jgi:tetratricopeptide (TPR) repeat protein
MTEAQKIAHLHRRAGFGLNIRESANGLVKEHVDKILGANKTYNALFLPGEEKVTTGELLSMDKEERKEIGLTASIEIKSLFNKFILGLNLLNEGKLQSSIIEFETITKEFPSREIYNNLGIARARMALLLKPKTKEEFEAPERFKYPLEIENKTRLYREDTRSIQLDNNYLELLGAAQSDFEKAISLDPSFVKSYINLACIYDLLDNPENAIGTIKRLRKVDQNTTDSKIILAIAYFHSDRESLAEKIWKELNL